MAKYKIGDRVRIVSRRPKADSFEFVKDMERFLGKVCTVSAVIERNGRTLYYFDEARPTNLAAKTAFYALGVPGYYFLESWISGPADGAPEEPLSVHIRFCGNLTVAELIKDGKVVKVENARCNPKGTYSWCEGAKIAVERLFAKKKLNKEVKR